MREIRGETGSQKLVGYVIALDDEISAARVWLDVSEQHLNRHGVLHGGITTMLLDTACGATGSFVADPDGMTPFLTVSFTTQFVAPAKPGRVEAVGKITGGGRSIKYISAELHDGEGVLIATGTGVFKPVPKERRG